MWPYCRLWKDQSNQVCPSIGWWGFCCFWLPGNHIGELYSSVVSWYFNLQFSIIDKLLAFCSVSRRQISSTPSFASGSQKESYKSAGTQILEMFYGMKVKFLKVFEITRLQDIQVLNKIFMLYFATFFEIFCILHLILTFNKKGTKIQQGPRIISVVHI